MTKPVVLIAEELSAATVDALGPDFDIRQVDGTDRDALFAALADASAVLVRSATKLDAMAPRAARAMTAAGACRDSSACTASRSTLANASLISPASLASPSSLVSST